MLIITPEINRENGGIQNWMYYLKKLLLNKYKVVNHYAYKEDKINFANIMNLMKSKIYFLATWKMGLFVLPVLLFTKRKFFIFVHGNEILNLNFLMRNIFKLMLKRENTYFISNSKAIANLFIKITNREIDFIQYPFMEINDIDKKNNIVNVAEFVTITRLVKRKNIENVIRAFYVLDKNNFNFNYTIAGSGPELKRLKDLVDDLELNNKIKIIGKVSEKKKREIYQKANYFLLPSVFDIKDGSIEGYGIVYIEANSFNLPVLSGNTGGMVEAVIDKKTGFHCDGSIEDIVKKVQLFLEFEFNNKDILQHAKKHDYLLQNNFISFIDRKMI